MQSRLSIFCAKFIEAGWLAALVLTPLFMNIYTHRMFEPDKAAILRSIAILMLVAYLIQKMEELGHPRPEITQPTGNWRMSLFLPVLLFAGSYILSCILSATPRASIWGSYDRSQGLYTFVSYLVVFFLAATHIKTREQVERIFTTVILTAIPIALYGIIQRVGWDPVPWQQMDPSKRISSTIGNPIFFGAYVIMVVPLVLARFTQAIYQKRVLLIICYPIVLGLLATTVVLTGSRSPMLALVCGLFIYPFIFSWRERIKWLLRTTIISSVLVIIFLALFNLPHLISKTSERMGPDGKYLVITKWNKLPAGNSIQPLWEKTFGKLRENKYIGRLGFILEHQQGTGRIRIILWKGIGQLITETPFRFMVGYGPESLATVYYKYFTMELTKYEGTTVHADRAHNILLDVWIMQGLIGLFAYLFLIAALTYLGIKALRRTDADSKYNNILLAGLLAAVLAHIIEAVSGIEIVCTITHFWVYAAGIYALVRIKLAGQADTTGVPASDNLSLPPADARALKEENEIFNAVPYHLLPKINLAKYILWGYIVCSFLLVVLLIMYRWPDENTNTDVYIIGVYLWFLPGLVLGALAIKTHRQPNIPVKWDQTGIYALVFAAALLIIYQGNINPIRADGYYKFCFSYDGGADQLMRNPPPDMKREVAIEGAFRTRFVSIPYYIKALKLNPVEKNYLNGAGRNFLELVKLQQMLPANSPYRIPDAQNKLSKPPSMEELLKIPIEDYSRFTSHDFFLCCVTVIEEAYQLEPKNYERILAMIRVNRFWGQIDKDPSKLMRALELCREASAAAPLHDTPHREVKAILQYLEYLK